MVNPSWDSGGSYTLIFDDEFTGTTLDTTKWQPGWFGASGVTPPVNSESPHNNSANVTVSGGYLNLQLTSSYGGLVTSNPNNSGTATGFEFSPNAAIEIRANLPQHGSNVANWCALWTDGQNWPDDGEIDILESLGAPDNNSYHVHDATNPDGVGGDHNLSPPYGFHTFGAYWTDSEVQFYYDGSLAASVATDGFTGPHYIVLVNTFSGSPDVVPTTLQVDWVRVWTPGGATTVSGTGSLALSPLALSGTNKQPTGTGSLALAPLAFSGNNSFTAPSIPVEPAGVIATSADLNAWGSACRYLMGSGTTDRPDFFLMASTTQSLTTSYAVVNFSSTAAVFKDNAGGWRSGSPWAYFVKVAGYYHLEWAVSAASGCGNLECFAEVSTTAANPYNPSALIVFQHTNRAATTAVTVASSGGLVPIYLAVGDEIVVFARVGTGVNTSATYYPQLSGQWVSE